MRVSWIRKTHRFLGLVIGLQLFLWTLSGFYFSWNDIEKVRGEHFVVGPSALALNDTTILSPNVVIASLAQRTPGIETIERVSLRLLLDEPVYEIKHYVNGEVRYALADSRTGASRSPLGRDEAVAVAQNDFVPDAAVLKTELVEEAGGHSEYRSRELPAYRVEFDHPSGSRIYVSVDRGLVTARRNNTWRVFDFLWMFHIMDYEARDDINNLILRVLSILGLATVVSGYLLWGFTSRFLHRRRRHVNTTRTVPL
jgi:uncharacterized iron-regulated membrane protein